MNKTEKRMKIFTLIMQVIIQAVLLFPWMNMGTWKYNVPEYLIKLAASGDGMSYIKKSLKPLGVLDGADEQMMVQILMLFICELVMVLVIQVIGIVNLILALSNHHKLLLDIMSLIAGCMISFLGADGAVFSDPLSQVYPFLLVVLLVINLIGAKLIDSWQEEKKIQEEVKAREKNYKEEKEKHLEFSGKYPKGFYTVLWKNFKSSKRDFIVYVSMNLLPATLIFSGVGMAQMLAPFNKEGNILTGHGITAILLEFLIVSLIASLMLMITNLLSYFRKRMRNYSIFSTLGMRKSTLYEVLGAEIVAGILGMLIGGSLHRKCDPVYHPQNLHGKIRSGSTAGEDYRIHIFDRKSYPDRNIRDWTDDPAGFLPVQGTKKNAAGRCGKGEDAGKTDRSVAYNWPGHCGIWNREFRNAEECRRVTDTFIYLPGHLSGGKVWIWIVPESAEA